MLARATFLSLLALSLVGLAGCGPAKLDVEKNYSLDSGEGNAVYLDAQSQPQTVTVTFESTKSEIEVLVFKKDDAPTENEILTADAKKALAGEKGKKSGTFIADVPANTPVTVVIRDPREKTDVKVHVTNRK